MDSQVLKHDPDLLIVAFGLNDVNGSLEDYLNSLKAIFEKSLQAEIDTIFMTPNMFNTHSGKVEPGEILEPLAEVFAKRQLKGVFDAYMDAARQICREENVTLCDCYAIWKIFIFHTIVNILKFINKKTCIFSKIIC